MTQTQPGSVYDIPTDVVAEQQATFAVLVDNEPGVLHRLQDIPFDPRADEVLFMPKLAQVRLLPAHTLELALLAVEPGGVRELGRYTFHHRPWSGDPGPAA